MTELIDDAIRADRTIGFGGTSGGDRLVVDRGDRAGSYAFSLFADQGGKASLTEGPRAILAELIRQRVKELTRKGEYKRISLTWSDPRTAAIFTKPSEIKAVMQGFAMGPQECFQYGPGSALVRFAGVRDGSHVRFDLGVRSRASVGTHSSLTPALVNAFHRAMAACDEIRPCRR